MNIFFALQFLFICVFWVPIEWYYINYSFEANLISPNQQKPSKTQTKENFYAKKSSCTLFLLIELTLLQYGMWI